MPSSVGRLSNAAVRDVFDVLKRSRQGLIEFLAEGAPGTGADPTEFQTFMVGTKIKAIEVEMDRLEVEIRTKLDGHIDLGALAAVTEVSDVSTAIGNIAVDAATVSLAKEIAASQIKKASEVMKAEVRIQLQRAFSGGLTLPQLQVEIGKVFKGKRTRGEIERIARTEVARVFSQAKAAATQELSDAGLDADLIKRWVATGGTSGDGRTREEHRAMHGQERELWQLFNMGDSKKGLSANAETPPGNKGYRINGPLDPTLPAHLVIHCRCDVIEVPRSSARMPYTSKTTEEALAKKRKAKR